MWHGKGAQKSNAAAFLADELTELLLRFQSGPVSTFFDEAQGCCYQSGLSLAAQRAA
jgi:hypothetical protein